LNLRDSIKSQLDLSVSEDTATLEGARKSVGKVAADLGLVLGRVDLAIGGCRASGARHGGHS
jgi:hypothetical protein